MNAAFEIPAGIPSFQDVITGDYRNEPWGAENYLNFLQEERNEENLFFVSEVEAYKKVKGDTTMKDPPEALLLLPEEVRRSESDFAQSIIDTFIKENAPWQINISEAQRQEILIRHRSISDGKIFECAQGELKKLMLHDSWPRFVRKTASENITKQDGYFRLFLGIVALIGYLIGFGLMLGYFVPRWYFFLLFFPILVAVNLIMSYKMRFCVISGVLGIRDLHGTVFVRKTITCPIVRGNLRRKSYRHFIGTVIATAILTVLSFSITYAVEAGQRRVLYG